MVLGRETHIQGYAVDRASGRVCQRRALKDEKVPAVKGSGERAVARGNSYAAVWRWNSTEAGVAGVRGRRVCRDLWATGKIVDLFFSLDCDMDM